MTSPCRALTTELDSLVWEAVVARLSDPGLLAQFKVANLALHVVDGGHVPLDSALPDRCRGRGPV